MISDHDDAVGRLVRLGGPRLDPTRDGEARVRRAFLDECLRARRRVRRRRAAIAAVPLALAALLLLLVRVAPRDATPPDRLVVGQVDVVEGEAGWRREEGAGTRPASLRVTEVVRVGDWLGTATDGRVAVRTTRDASVRLDRATKVRLVSADAIELASGAVYVDSGEAPPLDVLTPFGTVRHVGTQFEVRLEESAVRVRVRSGVVELQRGARRSRASGGTEVTVTSDGVSTAPVAAYGAEWAWTARVAPELVFEGRTLGAFLADVCREQGWRLTYDDASSQREAAAIVLHGSVAGLTPIDAVSVAVTTSGFTHRFADGELRVTGRSRQGDADPRSRSSSHRHGGGAGVDWESR